MKNTTRNLLIFSGVVVFVAGLFWLASTSEESDSKAVEYSQGSLAGSGQSFNFGTIDMQDGDVVHEFEIKNESVEPVLITKAYTSCMCTVAYIYDAEGKEYGAFGMLGHGRLPALNATVEPGETVIVKAVFDPAAHGPSGVGLADRVIYIETNSAQSPKMELSFRAMVTR
ncbi:MAG: DUF1573 domain-containing protein [Candidatus Spechtbacterales bacterium]